MVQSGTGHETNLSFLPIPGLRAWGKRQQFDRY
jgi:hypothetical protein